jgi:broad specificity phosphatase PhoE
MIILSASMKGKNMSIFLIRHAESEANINGKTLSHASIALSENGHIQAQALCSKLPQIDHVEGGQIFTDATNSSTDPRKI